MRKKYNFLYKFFRNIIRYFKLKELKKKRSRNRKKHPLEDYNYPLW